MRNLVAAAKVYRQKRIVRILLAALVLVAAVYGQYSLARIPLPVDVAKFKTYTPVTVELIKREDLVVDGPSPQSTDTHKGLLLADDGSEAVTVEAHFESARLDDEIMAALERAKQPLPPSGLQQVAYTTEGDAEASSQQPRQPPDLSARPCRTSIQVSLADNTKLPTELRFYQLEGPGADRFRTFEVKALGADLAVELLTRNLAHNFRAPGCVKTLSVGDWTHTLASPVPLRIVVPAGKSLQFWFTRLQEKPAWSGTAGLFEAFELEASPLSVRSVRRVAHDGAGSQVPFFDASSVQGKQPLLLKHLMIGSGELQLDYTGEAIVQENGAYAVTFNLWEFAKSNPLLAGILAMLDAALIEWIRRSLFK